MDTAEECSLLLADVSRLRGRQLSKLSFPNAYAKDGAMA
jgi:hypothetical protein